MSQQLSSLFSFQFPADIASVPNVNLVSPPSSSDDPQIQAGVLLATINAGLLSLVDGNKTLDDVASALVAGFTPNGTFGASANFNGDALGSGEILYGAEQTVKLASSSQTDVVAALDAIAPDLQLSTLAKTLQEQRNTVDPHPPTISGTPATKVLQDNSYSFTPTATDPDDSELTFSVTNLPQWASFDTATGKISGTPGNADVGVTQNVAVSVSDGFSTTTLPAFSITVVNHNEAPTIAGTPASQVNEDSAYSASAHH